MYTSRILASSFLVGLLGCCVFAYMIAFSSQQAAYALVPPIDPDSHLQGKWVSGGTDSQWDRRTYTSTASPDTLIAYYHTHFAGATYSVEHGTHHHWYKCDHSWLAKAVARWLNEGKYPFYTGDNVPLPCVSVSIDTDKPPGNETFYNLWIEWPSL